ncbi:MAG: Chitooligosaccharide deacetylase [Bacteroidota bacterium]
MDRIKSEGHSIGNHTMNHLNAWSVDFNAYLADVEACEAVFQKHGIQSIGFRPPYGRITRKMYKDIPNIVLWSVLTGDYNASLNLLKPGAIVVFHDSVKAAPHLKAILPAILAHCNLHNLSCSAL